MTFRAYFRLKCRPSVSPWFWVTAGWSHPALSQPCRLATSSRMHNWVLLWGILRADRWQFETSPMAFSLILTRDQWHTSDHYPALKLREPFQSVQMDHFIWAMGAMKSFWLGHSADCWARHPAVMPQPPRVHTAAECLHVSVRVNSSFILDHTYLYHTH